MVDGRGSVHILGGLDIDEMDCSEYSFYFIVLITSSGTTKESSIYGNFWAKKENWESKLSMLLKSISCAKKTFSRGFPVSKIMTNKVVINRNTVCNFVINRWKAGTN